MRPEPKQPSYTSQLLHRLPALGKTMFSQPRRLLVPLLPLVTSLLLPDLISLNSACWLSSGLVLGWCMARYGRLPASRRHRPANDVVAQDISTLQQAFAVLKQQVSATIQTSETAVMAMGERMSRVHLQTQQLRQQLQQVLGRSAVLSDESLLLTERCALAVARLAPPAPALAVGLSGDALGPAAELAAQHLALSANLLDAAGHLSELSKAVEVGMQEVSKDIVDTLGDMQFQDINRQLLEQINNALGSLSTHFSQLYQLIDGQAPPPPILLEELLQLWTKNYVMHSQRVAHAMALGGSADHFASVDLEVQAQGDAPLELASANCQRIELF